VNSELQLRVAGAIDPMSDRLHLWKAAPQTRWRRTRLGESRLHLRSIRPWSCPTEVVTQTTVELDLSSSRPWSVRLWLLRRPQTNLFRTLLPSSDMVSTDSLPFTSCDWREGAGARRWALRRGGPPPERLVHQLRQRVIEMAVGRVSRASGRSRLLELRLGNGPAGKPGEKRRCRTVEELSTPWANGARAARTGDPFTRRDLRGARVQPIERQPNIRRPQPDGTRTLPRMARKLHLPGDGYRTS